MLVIIVGYAGTGKTTLARRLARIIRAKVVSTDEVEKELEILVPDNSVLACKYPVTLLLAKYLLNGKQSVVLDGNFRLSKSRQYARELAEKSGVPFYIIRCNCPESIAQKRIKKKNQEVPGYYKETATFNYARLTEEPIEEPFLEVDTTLSEGQNIDRILAYIGYAK